MPKTYINPPSVFNSRQYGFSQLVVSPSGGKIFCASGQVAMDSAENIIGSDIGSQMHQALSNLSLLLQAAGGTLTDVISLRIYFVPSKSDSSETIGNVLREFFGTRNPPATTWIGVLCLARKEFLVEVEAMGVIGNG